MLISRFILILVGPLVMVLGCSHDPGPFLNKTEALKFFANSKNGLTIQKEQGSLRLSVTHLPENYVLHTSNKIKEAKDLEDISSLAFVLTISPAKSENMSLPFMAGVKTIEEYKVKVEELNFQLAKYISLFDGNREYEPTLYHMESNVDDRSKIRFYIVFEIDDHLNKTLKSSSDLRFTFEDRIFTTGINHFSFATKNILRCNSLEYNY